MKHVTNHEKLIPNLYDKKEYVLHIKNLPQYMALGLVVSRVHSVIRFKQAAWLKPYIDLNTRHETCHQPREAHPQSVRQKRVCAPHQKSPTVHGVGTGGQPGAQRDPLQAGGLAQTLHRLEHTAPTGGSRRPAGGGLLQADEQHHLRTVSARQRLTARVFDPRTAALSPARTAALSPARTA